MTSTVAPEVDPLESYEKRPSVSFDVSRGGYAKGQKVQLLVQEPPKMIVDRDAETKEIKYWPLKAGEREPKAKQKLVLNVVDLSDTSEEGGVEKTLWAKPVRKGKALFAALQEAQKKAREETGDKTYRLKAGDTLWVVYLGDDTTVPAKMGNHPKMFAAKIVPGATVVAEDPFADEAAPAGAVAEDPWATPAATPAAKPPIGGDPFGGSDIGEGDEPPF